jgi:hypothetical protein
MLRKRRVLQTIVVLAACSVIGFIAGAARSDDVSGVISGVIVDERSLPVSHAIVSVSAADAARGVRVTNSRGFFTFLGLLPGRYYVVASKGTGQVCSGSLSVIPGVTTNVRVTIRPRWRSSRPCSFTQREFGVIY